jgi:hypothetical protein
MNTKCLIKDPFTKGDYFHTTNPFYYGTKRPVIPKKNLNKPFDHSPFQPLISGVGFGNLPKVAVNSRPADARFQTDSRGWFPINQPKNRPFCFSPFELQISGVKTDQPAPFYQAGETMLSTDTIQKAIALGTEIRSAETSRKAQEAATFIPTIFQKIAKYTNDKLSNPSLTIADYLNAAELQYLKSLNVKSLEELKALMGTMNANVEAMNANIENLATAIPPAPAIPPVAPEAVPVEAEPEEVPVEAPVEEDMPDLEEEEKEEEIPIPDLPSEGLYLVRDKTRGVASEFEKILTISNYLNSTSFTSADNPKIFINASNRKPIAYMTAYQRFTKHPDSRIDFIKNQFILREGKRDLSKKEKRRMNEEDIEEV